MIRLASGLLWLLSLLPVAGPARLAGWLAPLWNRCAARRRQVAEANLRGCLPELTAAERQRLIGGSSAHYLCSVLETGRNWHWSLQRLQALCIEVTGGSTLRRALDSQRGLLLLTPHFGAWEYLGLFVQQFPGVALLYKPPRRADLARELSAWRGRGGAEMLPASPAGLRRAIRQLRAGGCVGMLPDQEPAPGHGRFAPLFGIPALTMMLPMRLLRATGCAALFMAAERRPGGRYRVHVLEPEAAFAAADTVTALAALNRGIERCIAIDPAQYLWSYKRFRTRPDGAPPFYGREAER